MLLDADGCASLEGVRRSWRKMADFGAGADFPVSNEAATMDVVNRITEMREENNNNKGGMVN